MLPLILSSQVEDLNIPNAHKNADVVAVVVTHNRKNMLIECVKKF